MYTTWYSRSLRTIFNLFPAISAAVSIATHSALETHSGAQLVFMTKISKCVQLSQKLHGLVC